MIRVEGLTKNFASKRGTLRAVDNLSLAVAAGEVYGLLGPNGAGKTTTLRMVLGLMPPDAGYAEVAGFRTGDGEDEVKRRVGFVSASAGLYPWLSPRELVLFFADLYGVPVEDAKSRLAVLAEIFGVNGFLDQRCSTLSSGQQQRVHLLRALIHDPPVMLLDEPTRGLDIFGSQVIFDYVAHLREQGKAVIISTHQLDEAQRLCDRFGLMHRGRLLQEGTLADMRSATGCDSLYDMFLRILPEAAPHAMAASRPAQPTDRLLPQGKSLRGQS
jgi:ABC-2 type transport system ATP-binding protein/sodium transport system ATP-binding protein